MKQHIAQIAALPLESIEEVFAPMLNRKGIELSSKTVFHDNFQFDHIHETSEEMVGALIEHLDESETRDAELTLEREQAVV